MFVNPYLYPGLKHKDDVLSKISKNDKQVIFMKKTKKIIDKYFDCDISTGKYNRTNTLGRYFFLYFVFNLSYEKTGKNIKWKKLSGFLNQHHSIIKTANSWILNRIETELEVKEIYNELLEKLKKL